jgi:biotin carboxylase
MRAFLHKHGLSPVAFTVGSKLTDFSGWARFPAIIKPVDSQGQRGVFEIESRAELKERFVESKSFSRCGDVIVEEFIEGPEYSANVFIRNGNVACCFISDRKVVEGLPGGIVRGHEVPARMSEAMQGKVRTLVSEIVSALQLENGPVYFQMRCMDDEVFIIEVTARLDGCHLWRLIKLKYGVDLLALSFDGLLGHEMPDEAFLADDLRPGLLRLDFDLQKPDTPFSMESVDSHEALYKELYYEPGEKVRRINGYAEKVGYTIREV